LVWCRLSERVWHLLGVYLLGWKLRYILVTTRWLPGDRCSDLSGHLGGRMKPVVCITKSHVGQRSCRAYG